MIDFDGGETDDHGNDDPEEGWQVLTVPTLRFLQLQHLLQQQHLSPLQLVPLPETKRNNKVNLFSLLDSEFSVEKKILLSSVSPLYGPPQGSLSMSLCNEVKLI